jgi:hypothetical protein
VSARFRLQIVRIVGEGALGLKCLMGALSWLSRNWVGGKVGSVQVKVPSPGDSPLRVNCQTERSREYKYTTITPIILFWGLLRPPLQWCSGVRSSREWLHYAGGMVKELFVQVCILAAPWNRPEAWYRLSYRNILRVQGWMTPKTQCWLPMLSSASKRVEQKLKTEEGRRQSLRRVNRADVCNTS